MKQKDRQKERGWLPHSISETLQKQSGRLWNRKTGRRREAGGQTSVSEIYGSNHTYSSTHTGRRGDGSDQTAASEVNSRIDCDRHLDVSDGVEETSGLEDVTVDRHLSHHSGHNPVTQNTCNLFTHFLTQDTEQNMDLNNGLN